MLWLFVIQYFGGRTAAWKMGDENESLVFEESRRNYGSFFTNGLRNCLYRNTTEERWVKVTYSVSLTVIVPLYLFMVYLITLEVARAM
jgi:hypothetical protein